MIAVLRNPDVIALCEEVHEHLECRTRHGILADAIEEAGDAVWAEFIRLCADSDAPPSLESPRGLHWRPAARRGRVMELWGVLSRSLLGRLPRAGCGKVGFHLGRPLVWVDSGADLGLIDRKLSAAHAVVLRVSTFAHREYQAAMSHRLARRVVRVEMAAVDELDVVAIQDTPLAAKPVEIVSRIVYPAAVEAARAYLPRATLTSDPVRRHTAKYWAELNAHRNRFAR